VRAAVYRARDAGGGEEGEGVEKTLVAETGVECLDALEDADAALGGGGTAVCGCEGFVDEVGVEVFELCAHA
jgi:hypothetical protein